MGCPRLRHRRLYLAGAAALTIVLLLLIGHSSDEHKSGLLRTMRGKSKARSGSANVSSRVLSEILESEGGHTITSIDKKDLLRILTQESKCPACFGEDLCEEITTQYVSLTSADPSVITNSMMSFMGKLGSVQDVTIRVPRPDVLGSFDQIVCPDNKLKKWSSKCHSTIDAENPFLLTPKQFISHESITNFREQLSLAPLSPHIVACPTIKHKDVLLKAYDGDEDGKLSIEERNWLHTAITVAPEVVALKLAVEMGLASCLPELLGVCGRVFVLKGSMSPLSVWLDKPFWKRASLAASLLSRIEDFLTDSGSWIMLQPQWSIQTLQVDSKEEVHVASMDTLSFIEKKDSPSDLSERCDWSCVHALAKKVSSQKGYCVTAEEAMHLMYSHACAMVLSDMTQHKFMDYFSTVSSQRIIVRQFPGLLHGIPSKDRSQVESLLSSCVDEVEAGERLNAVEEIQDILADILEDEEDTVGQPGEQDDKEQEDDDDDDSYEESVVHKSET